MGRAPGTHSLHYSPPASYVGLPPGISFVQQVHVRKASLNPHLHFQMRKMSPSLAVLWWGDGGNVIYHPLRSKECTVLEAGGNKETD